MSWTDENNNTKVVKTTSNGNTRDYEFPSNTTLKDAVLKICRENGYKNADVESDGDIVSESRGNEPLSAFGEVTVTPRFAGANQ